ncbi:MAG: sensor histidine kinase [Beijerinckiaceae bacterium]|nr:sensor histidine kinase [Beijerinckiaceae bacterium]MCI0600556.1 sensor histidine kinase [Beijerinckiaceae bacterium]MCI0735208.1 sensor histidine kinase [Beijerinckiaceae bacterium]
MAKRLFFSATLLSSAILVVSGIILSAIDRRAAEANFDEHLGVYLRALIADISTPGEDSLSQPGQLGEPHFEIPLSGWYWQITRLDAPKPEIRNSRSLFAAKLPQLSGSGISAGVGGARKGYVPGPDNRTLRIVERIIDSGDQGIFLIQVAATTEELEAGIFSFRVHLSLTFAALALALVISSAVQLRYGLKPLRKLQEGVAAIRRGDAETIEGDFPIDISQLADELNLLVAANRAVVEHARTQVGNLAHALKTPLSVIVNEASADQGPLASKVAEHAAIIRDQLSFHLNRARAAVRARTFGSTADVAAAVEALVRTFEKIYAERAIGFTAAVPEPLRFQGERQDLDEMVGNLIDNAGKWARRAVAITAAPEPKRDPSERVFFLVTIDDDGPGLSPGLRQAALSRGKQLDETKPGSGLGLSIVADLASLYGGRLSLDDSPRGGLRAALRLPLA